MFLRILRAMFATKTPEPKPQTIDEFVDELVKIAIKPDDTPEQRKTTSTHCLMRDGKFIPTVELRCPSCDGVWYCLGYSRDYLPYFCPYCGIHFNPPTEEIIKKANLRDERKVKA